MKTHTQFTVYLALLTCWLFLSTNAFAAFCVAKEDPVPCTMPVISHLPGTLVGWIDVDNKVVMRPIGDSALPVVGLELLSENGLLIPVPADTSAMPFMFLLSNLPHQITYANLGASFSIEPEGVTFAKYDLASSLTQGTNPCDDLHDNANLRQSPTDSFCTIAGDVDFDGAVTFSDLLVFSQNFGNVGAVWPDGDFDWDGAVGFPDFLLLAENFGRNLTTTSSAQSVPEPRSLAMVLPTITAALGLLRRRR